MTLHPQKGSHSNPTQPQQREGQQHNSSEETKAKSSKNAQRLGLKKANEPLLYHKTDNTWIKTEVAHIQCHSSPPHHPPHRQSHSSPSAQSQLKTRSSSPLPPQPAKANASPHFIHSSYQQQHIAIASSSTR
ncbi:hypothetical protein U1Q18_032933 [Sarracenia purpurea var. burkii]